MSYFVLLTYTFNGVVFYLISILYIQSKGCIRKNMVLHLDILDFVFINLLIVELSNTFQDWIISKLKTPYPHFKD